MDFADQRYGKRDGLVAKQLVEAEAAMARRADKRARELKMTQPMRAAVERAARKVFSGRYLFLIPKCSKTRQKFLKMMLTLSVASQPRLAKQAVQVARYYARNYAYEWSVHPVTRPARERAREMILSNADSEFGETPMAAGVAYARHHAKEARVTHLANYGEIYTRALRMSQGNFFRDRGEAMRQKLGLNELGETASHAAASMGPGSSAAG